MFCSNLFVREMLLSKHSICYDPLSKRDFRLAARLHIQKVIYYIFICIIYIKITF